MDLILVVLGSKVNLYRNKWFSFFLNPPPPLPPKNKNKTKQNSVIFFRLQAINKTEIWSSVKTNSAHDNGKKIVLWNALYYGPNDVIPTMASEEYLT